MALRFPLLRACISSAPVLMLHAACSVHDPQDWHIAAFDSCLVQLEFSIVISGEGHTLCPIDLPDITFMPQQVGGPPPPQ